MSVTDSESMPNAHQALLKCQHLLEGRVALLGIAQPSILSSLSCQGLAMSENAGVFGDLPDTRDWQALFGYEPAPECAASHDTVVVFLPKAREEVVLRLSLALWLIAEGGRLILIGGKKEGIARAGKQFQAMVPAASKVDSIRHCQIWMAEGVTPAPDFSVRDFLSWHPVEYRGVGLNVAGLPGIFSDGRLDEGTALLLDSLAEIPVGNGPMLDFACGAGVIGAWLQQWRSLNGSRPEPVEGVDVQYQAITCARETYRANGALGEIIPSDGLRAVQQRYRTIVSNPPFHTGVRTDMSVTEAFLAGVARFLLPGGELRLVANSFLGYEKLIRRYIGPVETVAGNGRFAVYRCIRK